MGWGQFKPLLSEVIISAIEPIQMKYKELIKSPKEIEAILSQGQEKANTVAIKTLARVKNALGFLN